MAEQLIIDGSLKVTNEDAGSLLEPALPLTMSDSISERSGGLKFSLDKAASDLRIAIPQVEIAKYLLITSDVVVQVKLNASTNTPIAGNQILIGAGAAREIYVTNLGLLFDEGRATAGGATTLTDLCKQWTYTKVTGTRVLTPVRFTQRRIRMHVNGRSDTLTLTADDADGPTLATAFQSAIDASEIGSGQVTVAWDPTDEVLTFTNQKDGANPILFEAVDGDGQFLGIVGLVTPTSVLGGARLDACRIDLLAGTGQDQTKTIQSNTGNVITVSSAWTTPPDDSTIYRIYRPSHGKLTLFAAR